MRDDMREVTQDEYYRVVGQLDVVGTVIGKYPYTHIHKLRYSGVEVGRIVDGGDLRITATHYCLIGK